MLKVAGSAMEYVAGTPLSQVLTDGTALRELGAEVGRVAAAVSSVPFDRPGFFADAELGVRRERPWSEQLPGFSAECMDRVPADIEDHARSVRSDLNPEHPGHRRASHRGPGGAGDPPMGRRRSARLPPDPLTLFAVNRKGFRYMAAGFVS